MRVMLHTHWSAEAWSRVRVEFRKAVALRSEIRRTDEDDRKTPHRASTPAVGPPIHGHEHEEMRPTPALFPLKRCGTSLSSPALLTVS